MILLDSLTKLTRACNYLCDNSGKTLSGGLDAGAFAEPKRFFGTARNTREAGSVTILATVLVDTGSRMDDVMKNSRVREIAIFSFRAISPSAGSSPRSIPAVPEPAKRSCCCLPTSLPPSINFGREA